MSKDVHGRNDFLNLELSAQSSFWMFVCVVGALHRVSHDENWLSLFLSANCCMFGLAKRLFRMVFGKPIQVEEQQPLFLSNMGETFKRR